MHTFTVEVESPQPASILVVDIPAGLRLGEVLDAFYRQYPDRLALANVLLVRPPVGHQIQPEVIRQYQKQPFEPLPLELRFLGVSPSGHGGPFDRVPNLSVCVLHSAEFVLELSSNINPSSVWNPLDEPDVNKSALLADIQYGEMHTLIELGRAELAEIGGTLYRAPSGHLVPSFLRVGNIQVSRAALDAIFFWLLPYLESCDGIITDIWSISSVALNVSRRLCTYQTDAKSPCPVEMLGEYFVDTETNAFEAKLQLRRLLRLAKQRKESLDADSLDVQVLFLMSAVRTGTLFTRLRELLRSDSIADEEVYFVCLYKLGDAPGEIVALHDLSSEAKYQPVSDEGSANGEIIEIDARTYFPAQQRDIEHNIPVEFIDEFRQTLLEPYAGTELITVHQSEHGNGASRHHGIRIDTIALARHETFRSKLRELVFRLDPAPNIILTPGHHAGRIMAKFLREELASFGHNVRLFYHPNLFIDDAATSEEKELQSSIQDLGESNALLLLDDSFISGTRLTAYQTHLRRIKFEGAVHYVAGVARPSSMAEWNRRTWLFRSACGNGSTTNAVETVILPNWNEADCPWCQELYALRDHVLDHDLGDFEAEAKVRLAQLSYDPAFGRGNEIFLKPKSQSRLSFTPGSFYGPTTVSDAWIIGCVASAIQWLRTAESENITKRPHLGPRRFPVVTVLRHSEYLKHTWTDSLLRAAIIRSAQPYELVYSDRESERERIEAAKDLILSSLKTEHDLFPELVVAEMTGRFPKLQSLDFSIGGGHRGFEWRKFWELGRIWQWAR